MPVTLLKTPGPEVEAPATCHAHALLAGGAARRIAGSALNLAHTQARAKKMMAQAKEIRGKSIPEHLKVGVRVEHSSRGVGTVDKHQFYPLKVYIAFDNGGTHGYTANLWHKIKRSDTAAAVLPV